MVKFFQVEVVQSEIEDVVAQFLDNCTEVTDEQRKILNKVFDRRAVPHKFHFGDDFVVVENQYVKNLNYYGGFEYVDADYVTTMGNYTVYSADCDRVQDLLDAISGEE